MLKKAFIASLFVALLALLYGCGQQTTTMTSANQANGLIIRGTIRNFNFNPDAFTFVVSDPVAGAHVMLDGNGQSQTTIANANGEYIFTNIPDGQYAIMATAEGTLTWTPLAVINIKPGNGTPANGTVFTQDLNIYRFAITTGYSPEAGSVITLNQSFTVNFNTPMDTSTVRFSLVPQGLRTMADNGDTVQVDLTWTNGNRTVTITPQGALSPNQNYRLLMSYLSWTNPNPYPRDAQGGRYISGDSLSGSNFLDVLPHFADYKTVAGGVPGTPSNLMVSYQPGAVFTSEADFNDIWNDLYLGNSFFFAWNSPTSGGPISGYNLYTANGDSKEYLKVNPTLITTNQYTSNVQEFERTFWPAGIVWSDPICGGNYPFINNPCHVKVVAVNGDGEGPAVELVVQDNVPPRIEDVISAGSAFAGATLPTNIYLPAIDDESSGEAYVLLSEPVRPNSVPGNVTIAGVTLTATIVSQSVNQMTVNGVTKVMSVIKLDAGATNIRTLTVKLESGLRDLIGNSPRAGSRDTFVIP